MRDVKETDNYTTIKLPNEIVDKIDGFIKQSDDGYTSRTDLIKTALRDFFRNKNFSMNGVCKK